MSQDDIDRIAEALEKRQNNSDPHYTRISELREDIRRRQAQFSLSMAVLIMLPTLLGFITIWAFKIDPIPTQVLTVWLVWCGFWGVIFVLGSLMFDGRLRMLK